MTPTVKTTADPAEAIAAWLPAELEEVARVFLQHSNEQREIALIYLKHLHEKVLPSGAPWTTHLLIMFALMPLDNRHHKRSLQEHYGLYSLLQERWEAAGESDSLPEQIDLTAGSGTANQIREAARFLKKYKALISSGGAAVQKYQLNYTDVKKGLAPGWEPLKDFLSPELYQLCTTLLPETSPRFGEVKYIIQRVLKLEIRDYPFRQQLVLMAAALAFDSKNVVTKRKYINLVARNLPKVLDAFKINAKALNPDQHLISYLQATAGQERDNFNQAYQESALAITALLRSAPEHEATIRAWQLLPMGALLRQQLEYDTADKDGSKATREQIDLVREHWQTIHALAETRALAVRLLMLEVGTVLTAHPDGPFPLTCTVHQPDDTLWPFRIWTTRSYVDAHPDLFDAGWLDRNKITSTPFLEWREGDEYSLGLGPRQPTKPWFTRLVAYQNAEKTSRADFIKQMQYTEETFDKMNSYPTLEPELLSRVFRQVAETDLEANRSPRCLFEPCELFGDVLTALLQLRLARTIGSRQHEVLQVRLEPKFLYKTPPRPNGAGPAGAFIVLYLKGDKGTMDEEATRSIRYIPERTVLTILDLKKLRDSTGQGHVEVQPSDPSLHGLPAGRYLLHNGRKVLRPGETNRRLRFLLFGWEAVVKLPRKGHVKAHDLRHGFATMLALGGFRMAVIAGILGHTDERTSRHYAQQSRAVQKQAEEELQSVMQKALNTPRPTVYMNHEPLIGNEPRVISALRPSAFLEDIYTREDQARADMNNLKGA